MLNTKYTIRFYSYNFKRQVRYIGGKTTKKHKEIIISTLNGWVMRKIRQGLLGYK